MCRQAGKLEAGTLEIVDARSSWKVRAEPFVLRDDDAQETQRRGQGRQTYGVTGAARKASPAQVEAAKQSENKVPIAFLDSAHSSVALGSWKPAPAL